MFDGEVYADFVAALARLPPVPRRGRAPGGVLARALDAGGSRARDARARRAARRRRGGDRRRSARASSPTRPTRELRDALRDGDARRAGLLPRSCCGSSTGCCSSSSPRTATLLLDPTRRRDGARALPRATTRPRGCARLAERRRGGRARTTCASSSSSSCDALGDDDGCPRSACPRSGASCGRRTRSPHLDERRARQRATCSTAIRALATCDERQVAARRRLPQPRRRGARLGLRVAARAAPRARPRRRRPSRSTTAAGNERKTTGSYYTPTSLITVAARLGARPGARRGRRSRRPGGGDPRPHGAATRPAAPGTSSSPPPTASPSGSPRSAPATPSRRPDAMRTRAARRRRPLHLRRRRQPDGRRAVQGLASGWRRSSPAGRCRFLDHHIKCGNSLLGATPALLGERHPRRRVQAARRRRQEGRHRAAQAQHGRARAASATLFDAGDPLDDAATLGEAGRASSTRSPTTRSSDAREREAAPPRRCSSSDEHERAAPALPTPGAPRSSRPSDASAPADHASERLDRAAERRAAGADDARDEIAACADRVRASSTGTSSSRRLPRDVGDEPTAGRRLRRACSATRRGSGSSCRRRSSSPLAHPEIAERAERGRAQAADRRSSQTSDPALLRRVRGGAARRRGREPLPARSSGRYPALRPRRRQHLRRVRRDDRAIIGATRPGRAASSRPGIATDDTTKLLLPGPRRTRRSLVSLFDFENEEQALPRVGHSRTKFCLLTLAGPSGPHRRPSFVFFATTVPSTSAIRSDASR